MINTGTLDNSNVLLNNGTLLNYGTLQNDGQITSTGVIESKGVLTNNGMLLVAAGGNVKIEQATNLKNGVLAGGTWQVDSGSTGTASLAVDHGAITTNNATVVLRGANSNFEQLNGLTHNQGSLTVEAGRSFTTTADKLTNTGTLATGTGGTLVVGKLDNTGLITSAGTITGKGLTNNGTLRVTAGGDVKIEYSDNLNTGVLSGGTWQVDSGNTGTASLAVGKGAITTNNATIVLRGANSQFEQLNGLTHNQGSLTVEAGRSFTTAAVLTNTGTLATGVGGTMIVGTKLVNNGTLQNDGQITSTGVIESKGVLTNNGMLLVAAGGNVKIEQATNLKNGVLAGGTWQVDSGSTGTASLAVDHGAITTNNATVVLRGANSNFEQLNGLTHNQGSLTVEAGRSFTTTADKLTNTGPLATGTGGTLVVAGKLANSGVLTNSGDFLVSSKGNVDGPGSFVQAAGSTSLQHGARLSAETIQILGGTVSGSGTIHQSSGMLVASGATVRPEGKLTLQGDTQFDGELDINIFSASKFSILRTISAINFGSGAEIKFVFDPEFTLTDFSYDFQFLETNGDIAGLDLLTYDFWDSDAFGLAKYSKKLSLECAVEEGDGCGYSLKLTKLAVNGVPETGTLPLTALGLSSLALVFEHRRRKRYPAPTLIDRSCPIAPLRYGGRMRLAPPCHWDCAP